MHEGAIHSLHMGGLQPPRNLLLHVLEVSHRERRLPGEEETRPVLQQREQRQSD